VSDFNRGRGYGDDDFKFLESEMHSEELSLSDCFEMRGEPLTPRDYQREAAQEAMKVVDLPVPDRTGVVHIGPGGGKTLVGVLAVLEHLKKTPWAKVFWVAPNWILLEQAARTFINADPALNRNNNYLRVLDENIGGFMGGLREMKRDMTGVVVFSTLQKMAHSYRGFVPTLIVIDEFHWGHRGELQKLSTDGAPTAAIIGLTATPKPLARGECSVSSLPLCKLWKYLARPLYSNENNIKTGFTWAPEFVQTGSRIISQHSYDQLNTAQRNRKVLEYLRSHRSKLGKTLVFCVNQDQARSMAIQAGEEFGLPADYAISDERSHSNAAIAKFRMSKDGLLFNVGLLLQGADIPDIKSVVLCYPTQSAIRFVQMAGRGMRPHPSKNLDGQHFFNLICCNDSILQHEEVFVSPVTAFGDENEISEYSDDIEYQLADEYDEQSHEYYTDEIPDETEGHSFGERGPIVTHQFMIDAFNSIELPFRRDQTFGLELEFTDSSFKEGMGAGAPEWETRAYGLERLLRKNPELNPELARISPEDYPEGYAKHFITYDGSYGWELVTRVMRGKNGLQSLTTLLSTLAESRAPDGRSVVLDSLGRTLTVNHRTGLHLHLGFEQLDFKATLRLMEIVALAEPFLYCLVSPSRLFKIGTSEPNPYAVPISMVVDPHQLERVLNVADLERIFRDSPVTDREDPLRYLTVNFSRILQEDAPFSTIEVRMHNGSFEARKIIPWISLWMNLLNAQFDDSILNQLRTLYKSVGVGNVPIPSDRVRNHLFHFLKIVFANAPASSGIFALFEARAKELDPGWNVALSRRDRKAA